MSLNLVAEPPEPPDTPVRRTEIDTHDSAEAWAFLDRSFGSTLRNGSDLTRMRFVRQDFGDFSVDEVEIDAEVSFEAAPMPWLLVQELRGGRSRFRRGGHDDEVGPGALAAVTAPGEGFEAWLGSRLRERLVAIDLVRVDDAARELAGHDREGPVRFTSLVPVTPAANTAWARLVDYVATAARTTPGLAAHPIVVDDLTRMLARAAVATFPNDAWNEPVSTTPARNRRDATSPTVRRAVAFIEAAADRPIGLVEIAAAAHVTPRALQYAFRRHLDTTPLAHLRAVRLQRVREELLERGPEATVAQVAARWGFHSPGRFAAEYRARFGEYPSRTIQG